MKYKLTYERADIEVTSNTYLVTVTVEADTPAAALAKFQENPDEFNCDPDELEEVKNGFELLETEEIGDPAGMLNVYAEDGGEPLLSIEIEEPKKEAA